MSSASTSPLGSDAIASAREWSANIFLYGSHPGASSLGSSISTPNASTNIAALCLRSSVCTSDVVERDARDASRAPRAVVAGAAFRVNAEGSLAKSLARKSSGNINALVAVGDDLCTFRRERRLARRPSSSSSPRASRSKSAKMSLSGVDTDRLRRRCFRAFAASAAPSSRTICV